jgi:hypothetical protein
MCRCLALASSKLFQHVTDSLQIPNFGIDFRQMCLYQLVGFMARLLGLVCQLQQGTDFF